jgi:hypothetical protein
MIIGGTVIRSLAILALIVSDIGIMLALLAWAATKL